MSKLRTAILVRITRGEGHEGDPLRESFDVYDEESKELVGIIDEYTLNKGLEAIHKENNQCCANGSFNDDHICLKQRSEK